MNQRERVPYGGREKWRVVLAEDNDDHALLIEMALRNASAVPVELTRASNGDEAIEVIQRVRPDLVLLDLRMPGRDGHEVLTAVKSDDALRAIPVAVLTSSDRDDDIEQSYGLGGNHFLTKPDNPVELENRLRALLKNVGEMRGIRRGATGLEASARSAAGPSSLQWKRSMPWIAVAGVVIALVIFAATQGLFS
ncbi:MAG: response regulator [Longimicrobiales bacterium]|nr:response regulator [Longimicrobiales bacterium]